MSRQASALPTTTLPTQLPVLEDVIDALEVARERTAAIHAVLDVIKAYGTASKELAEAERALANAMPPSLLHKPRIEPLPVRVPSRTPYIVGAATALSVLLVLALRALA